MLKRKSIILSVLVVASLICSQPYGIVKAAEEEEWKQIIRPGTASIECKPLEVGLAIKVYRDQVTLCASKVYQHATLNCSDTGKKITKSTELNVPINAFSGTGNQYCKEAIALFKNSPGCWEINSGDGNTYYVPIG